MIPTVTLPRGETVAHTTRACLRALDAFAALEPTHFALAHWLATSYRDALVGARANGSFTLHMTAPVEEVIVRAQAELAKLRREASEPATDIVAGLPQRVSVARIRDELGNVGFGPIDVRGAHLDARVLSLFLADYLTRPEHYLAPTAA